MLETGSGDDSEHKPQLNAKETPGAVLINTPEEADAIFPNFQI